MAETRGAHNLNKLIDKQVSNAANLVDASEYDKYQCSCLFAKSLKEVVESRGKDIIVKEIHLVDLDEKIISLLCKAFQELDTMDSKTNQTNRKTERKPASTPKSGKELPVRKSDGDQINVENLSGTCGFDNCKRKGEKRCKNCCKVVCKLCILDIDSSKTQCPFCMKNFNSEEKTAREKQQEEPDIPSDEADNCPICMGTLTSPKMLPCGHEFHAECIGQSLKYKKTCPICGQVVGKLTGYQPPGLMHYKMREDITPPGFEKCGTIEISYDFPDGIQGEDHPHPGMPYQGTRRRTFLPNNTEGQKVLQLLKVAFERKLIFSIGESRTTGKQNTVTWNGIHHKTKIDGGPRNFGYPDETYLKRVQEELADKGVTEKDITGSDAEFGKSAYSKGSMHGNPAASWKSNSKKSVFHLSEKTCVKLYECSIVDVKDVDAVACAIDTDFNIERRAVARAIRKAGGTRYEEEFKHMVSRVSHDSREEVFICEAGNLCRSNNIQCVIHIKVPGRLDIEKLRHHYIQVFEYARKWHMEKIAMPFIGAANLVDASEYDKYQCSCLFAKTLKEVVESRGKDMTVKEIHLVDLDEKIISLLCKAFQDLDTMDSNTNQTNRKTERKPASAPKSGKELPVRKSDGDQINVENLSGKCSFNMCKRKGEKRCKNCCKVVCKLCILDIDSSKTQCPFCMKNFNSEEKTAREKQQEEPDIPSDEADNCPICMGTLTSPKMLPCGHEFHAECIGQSLKYKKTCPICGQVVGKLTGYQPPGLMHYKMREDITPPGFEKCGTIEISYDFPDGIQGGDHPHPGMPYQGTRRRTFLPNNTEGQKVLKLLKVAFERKLIFSIGESRTTGKQNTVTWNGIHHKTKIDGGPRNFGYPDETYLKRVQEELADKGVTEKDITGTPSRYRLVQEASGSDHELSSDFVEGSESK